MKLPCEICIWKIVPLIKKEIVLYLHQEKDLKQVEITKKMNLSKASVSHYLNRKRAHTNIKLTLPVKKMIATLAEDIIQDKPFQFTFCQICKIIQKENFNKELCP